MYPVYIILFRIIFALPRWRFLCTAATLKAMVMGIYSWHLQAYHTGLRRAVRLNESKQMSV